MGSLVCLVSGFTPWVPKFASSQEGLQVSAVPAVPTGLIVSALPQCLNLSRPLQIQLTQETGAACHLIWGRGTAGGSTIQWTKSISENRGVKSFSPWALAGTFAFNQIRGEGCGSHWEKFNAQVW